MQSPKNLFSHTQRRHRSSNRRNLTADVAPQNERQQPLENGTPVTGTHLRQPTRNSKNSSGNSQHSSKNPKTLNKSSQQFKKSSEQLKDSSKQTVQEHFKGKQWNCNRTNTSIQGVDGNGARADEDFVRLQRRDLHVRAKLKQVGPTEGGKKHGSAVRNVGFETVVTEKRGRYSGEVAIARNPHLLSV